MSKAFRPEASLEELTAERDVMEKYFRDAVAEITDALRLYRYDYIGTYGSLWRASDGRRRVHASSGIVGRDIRQSAPIDYVDFPEAPLARIEEYYADISTLKEDSDRCKRIFEYTRTVANG